MGSGTTSPVGRWWAKACAAHSFLPTCLVPCPLPGCSGALAKECTSLYPGCQVTVFDIPEVVQTAKTHFSFPEEGRISFCEGGLFPCVHGET